MRCPVCGTENHESARSCAVCGSPLSAGGSDYYDSGDIYNEAGDHSGPVPGERAREGRRASADGRWVRAGRRDPADGRRTPAGEGHEREPGGMHSGPMTMLALVLILAGLAVIYLFVYPGSFRNRQEPAAQTQETAEEMPEEPQEVAEAEPEAGESREEEVEKEEEDPAPAETDPGQDHRPFLTDDGTRFPDSSQRYLSYGEIKNLDLEQIQTCINDIFAREGYIFKDSQYLNYYRQYDWYVERIPADSFDMKTDLNEIEYANVELLAARRSELKP